MTSTIPFPNNPADNLLGITINGVWQITEQLPRPGTTGAEDLTGAWFSAGYIATNGKKKAFVKVIDVHKALQNLGTSTLMERIKTVADSHTFECSVLDICDKAKLDRVVTILAQGELNVPAPLGVLPIPLPFIMFELADGDVRKIIAKAAQIDDIWRFNVLHDVAVGLQQLHSKKIAHQDLKPSNVLLFDSEKRGAKIGDLGRASVMGKNADHDGFAIAGAKNYAPPEQIYGVRPERWEDRREGCDLYHLGSLATFIFAGVAPNTYFAQVLPIEIKPPMWHGAGTCDYQTALPVLTSSLASFVQSISADLPGWAVPELSQMILNACNPDYAKRGDPGTRKQVGSPIGIDTFVSRFDRLAKRAVIEAKK